jgi:hypothetical protein
MTTFPYKQFFIGCLITSILIFASLMGGFRNLNILLSDQLLHLPLSKQYSGSSLMIRIDKPLDQELSADLNTLIPSLQVFNPKSIILLQPSKGLRHLTEAVTVPVTLAVAEHVTVNSKHQQVSRIEIEKLGGTYRKIQMPAGASVLDSYRDVDDSFRAKAQGSYLNFLLRPESLPNITLSQALQGYLIEGLVADKVIYIDLEDQLGQSRQQDVLGELSYGTLQMLAAETLANEKFITPLSEWVTGLLLLMLFVAHFFGLQLVPSGRLLALAGGYSIAIPVISLLFSYIFSILLPTLEILIVLILTVMFYILIERNYKWAGLGKIIARINASLGKKLELTSFYQAEDPWHNLHVLINQQLNLNRSIFLEKVPNDHRVREVHALNCNIDDIEERRRDYRRRPYSDSIVAGKPTELSFRNYFIKPEGNEIEYLVPLVSAGDVLGFWALTVIPGEEWDRQEFENNLDRFCGEIAELLFHKQRLDEQRHTESSMLYRVLTLSAGETEISEMNRLVMAMEKRLDLMHSIYDGMNTASLLYSLFGQVVQSNRMMERLAEENDLRIYKLSAYDLLVELTGLSPEYIKQLLLNVTLKGQAADLRLNHPSLGDNYVLKIRPVKSEQQDNAGTPFLVSGILFEFINLASIETALAHRGECLVPVSVSPQIKEILLARAEPLLQKGWGVDLQIDDKTPMTYLQLDRFSDIVSLIYQLFDQEADQQGSEIKISIYGHKEAKTGQIAGVEIRFAIEKQSASKQGNLETVGDQLEQTLASELLIRLNQEAAKVKSWGAELLVKGDMAGGYVVVVDLPGRTIKTV